MGDDDGNVKKLNVRFKKPPTEDQPTLKVVWSGSKACDHRHRYDGAHIRNVQYLIREGETEVECGGCGVKLDPMFVLKVLAGKESRWLETAKRYQEEMARLNDRQRTKCQHCDKMTRISRK